MPYCTQRLFALTSGEVERRRPIAFADGSSPCVSSGSGSGSRAAAAAAAAAVLQVHQPTHTSSSGIHGLAGSRKRKHRYSRETYLWHRLRRRDTTATASHLDLPLIVGDELLQLIAVVVLAMGARNFSCFISVFPLRDSPPILESIRVRFHRT